MVIGADDDAIALAIELARGGRGGMHVVDGGRRLADLSLELAGLMSSRPAAKVAEAYSALTAAADALGCTPRDPFMALSFLGLEVIPSLKLTDRGLVDVERGRLVRG